MLKRFRKKSSAELTKKKGGIKGTLEARGDTSFSCSFLYSLLCFRHCLFLRPLFFISEGAIWEDRCWSKANGWVPLYDQAEKKRLFDAEVKLSSQWLPIQLFIPISIYIWDKGRTTKPNAWKKEDIEMPRQVIREVWCFSTLRTSYPAESPLPDVFIHLLSLFFYHA